MSAAEGQATQAVDRLLDGDQALLDKLLVNLAQAPATGRPPLPREQLIPLLLDLEASDQALASQLMPRLPAAGQLAAIDAALLGLVDELLQSWRLSLPLDAALTGALQRLRGPLAAWALATDGWLSDARHPLYGFMDSWTRAGLGWQPELGRGAERWLGQLEQALDGLARCPQRSALTAHLEQFEALVARDSQRLGRLEQRLRDSEQGQLQARRARQLAARLLNQRMGGRRLPPQVTEFLQRDCYQCLQKLALTEGSDSPRWLTVAKSLDTLVATLQPIDDEDRQQRYRLIPHCADALREALAPLFVDGAALEAQLAMIEAQHVKLLKGGSLAYAPFELIANHDPLLANASISRDLLGRVTQLAEGDWFLCGGDDGELRLRLCLKLEESQQLLFVNQLGLKAAQCSFEEFAYQLSTGQAQRLTAQGLLLTHVRRALGALYEQALSNQQARRQAMEDARRAREADMRQRQQARDKALAEARAHQAAQERAHREQHEATLATELARREDAIQRHGSTADQRRQQVRGLVSALRSGDWIHRYDELGNRQRLKLAVDLPSTGRLIFVDNHGVKQWDSDRAQITAGLLAGSVELLSKSAQFEDTLARVVGDLRRGRERRGEE
ncbi:MAG TPA: DUF1631 family protein [Spongiibacteraceae bacterium]|jgi:hypothetical protein|nr:DUF1631 family protein [Spongiibacteraceae bacterium]HUH38588.1 DUF1631 family protein [Spongiibacteraceae bacterium]